MSNFEIDAATGKAKFFFDFPELLDYVGLPASVFVSLQLVMKPLVNSTGATTDAFERQADWSMTIDTSAFLDSVELQPQAISIGGAFAYLGCWIFGICKQTDLPKIQVEVSTFWNENWVNSLSFNQFGHSITETIVDVQRIRDVVGVASACRTCGHRPMREGVTLLTATDFPSASSPPPHRLSVEDGDAAPGEAHTSASEEHGFGLLNWVKL